MKEIYKTIFVFVIIFAICKIDLLASDKWTHFKELNGNMISNIYSIEIDDSNNVYFVASQKVIKVTKDNLIDLTNHEYSENFYTIKKIEFSKSKILWGASEKGLMKYLPEKNSIKFFNRKEIMGDWDYEFILSIAINQESVWFVSRTPYLTVFDGQQFTDFDISLKNKIIDINLSKVPLIIDRNQDIWVGGQDGILKFSSKSTKDNMIYTKFSLSEIGFEGKVESLIEDDFGKIFASGRKGELSIYENDTWFPVSIPKENLAEEINQGVPNYITTMGIDNSKSIKLFWQIADFYLSIDSNMSFSKIKFPKEIIPYKTTVTSFKFDLNNILWFGTAQNGLINCSKNTTEVEDNEIIINNLLPEVFIRNIYPNPSIGRVTAELMIYPERLDELSISLYNYLGYKVMDLTNLVQINEKTGVSYIVFSIEDLDFGVYYFFIKKGKDKFVKPVIKIK